MVYDYKKVFIIHNIFRRFIVKIGVISSTKNSVNPLSFQAKIIDAHAHLGKIWDKNYGIDSLEMRRY